MSLSSLVSSVFRVLRGPEPPQWWQGQADVAATLAVVPHHVVPQLLRPLLAAYVPASRSFVTALAMGCNTTAADMAFLRQFPRLASLDLSLCTEGAGADAFLKVMRSLPTLTSLDLTDRQAAVDAATIEALARALPDLAALTLDRCDLTSTQRPLALSSMASLTALSICGVTSIDAALVADIARAPSLTSLALSCDKGSDRPRIDLAPLLQSTTLERLTVWSMAVDVSNDVVLGGARCVTAEGDISSLVHVDFTGSTLAPTVLPSLCELTHLTSVCLSLCGPSSSIGADGSASEGSDPSQQQRQQELLDQVAGFTGLQHLSLSWWPSLRPSTIAVLGQHSPALQSLDLSGAALDDDALVAVARSFDALSSLTLSSCEAISASSFEVLCTTQPSLTALDVQWCTGITSSAFSHIRHLRLLETLDVCACRVTTAVLCELLRSYALRRLRSLCVAWCRSVDSDALLEVGSAVQPGLKVRRVEKKRR